MDLDYGPRHQREPGVGKRFHAWLWDEFDGPSGLSCSNEFATRADAEAFILATPLQPPEGVRAFWKLVRECATEHRDKYSCGGGYFLRDQWNRDGRPDWRVRKERLSSLEEYPEVIELDWLS